MENPTMSNPAAGAAAPIPDKIDVATAIRCMQMAMRPYLSKMGPKERRAFAKGLADRLNHCLAVTRASEESRSGRNGYEAIAKKVHDRNQERNPEPSEKVLKVPDLDSIVTGDVKLVYICSPYRADNEEDRQRNISKAKALSWFACVRGQVPVVPHLMYPDFLDDDDPDEHLYGMYCAILLLGHCKEVWVMADCGISEGMQFEINLAVKHGIPVKYFSQAKEGNRE